MNPALYNHMANYFSCYSALDTARPSSNHAGHPKSVADECQAHPENQVSVAPHTNDIVGFMPSHLKRQGTACGNSGQPNSNNDRYNQNDCYQPDNGHQDDGYDQDGGYDQDDGSNQDNGYRADDGYDQDDGYRQDYEQIGNEIGRAHV